MYSIKKLQPPQPLHPSPFLGPIYYGEEYVWKVFDHQFPLDYDSVLYPGVMHYDAVIHNPPASEYGYDGHIGIDYSLEYEPVLASADGVVDVADWSNSANHRLGYGLHVVMSHDANADYTTIYGHLSTMNVETGDVIEIDLNDPGNRDRIIGISGNTGHVFNDANNDCAPIPISGANCGQHLHFETRRNGVVVNPYGWISSTPDPWALHEDGTVSHYLWANQPAALSTQYINSGPSGTQIVEPAVNNARMIIDDASADFSHYLQYPHEGESGLPPIPRSVGKSCPMKMLIMAATGR
ncbi:MAG: M23 family metallopeptidase [Chloroflexi bacterium]|nr:M23 family metallopeptidase [Chloroflexota bacterium]